VSASDDRTVAMPVTPPADAGRVDDPDGGRLLPPAGSTDGGDGPPPGAFDGPRVGAFDGEPAVGAVDDAPPIGAGQGPPGAFDGPPVDRTSAADARQSADPWPRLAGDFVDEPEKAVAQAHRLVQEAVDAVLAGVHGNGAAGGDDATSTEDLRLAFRRYREIHRVVSGL